ncbi:MAG TPA: hypothetical protein VJZ27_06855, partial [Aggregatilineales bacterium]|nr:hypothetical protein [Aggregatilineales bacterium]
MNENNRLNLDDFFPENDDAEASGAEKALTPDHAGDESDDSRPVAVNAEADSNQSSESVWQDSASDDSESRFVEFHRRTVSTGSTPVENAARETISSDTDAFEALRRETIEADTGAFEDLRREAIISEPFQEDDSELIEPVPPRDGFDDRLRRVRHKRQTTGELQPVQVRSRRRWFSSGCFVLLLGMAAISGGLLLLAFFLPPLDEYNPIMESVRAEEGFIALSSNDIRAETDGLV